MVWSLLSNNRDYAAKNGLQKCENDLISKSVTYDLTSGLSSCKNSTSLTGYTAINGAEQTTFLCGRINDLFTICSSSEHSKERVLAHEWAHNLDGTTDHVYEKDSKELANNNQTAAL